MDEFVFNLDGEIIRGNCSQCLPGTCNTETGTCRECRPGFLGEKCTVICPVGTFGMNCLGRCPDACDMRTSCHHVTGICLDGCIEGFAGSFCNDTCAVGYFGKNCARACSPNCLEQACYLTSGQCISCRFGRTGPFCDKPLVRHVEDWPTKYVFVYVIGIIALGISLWAYIACIIFLKTLLVRRLTRRSGTPPPSWVRRKSNYRGLIANLHTRKKRRVKAMRRDTDSLMLLRSLESRGSITSVATDPFERSTTEASVFRDDVHSTREVANKPRFPHRLIRSLTRRSPEGRVTNSTDVSLSSDVLSPTSGNTVSGSQRNKSESGVLSDGSGIDDNTGISLTTLNSEMKAGNSVTSWLSHSTDKDDGLPSAVPVSGSLKSVEYDERILTNSASDMKEMGFGNVSRPQFDSKLPDAMGKEFRFGSGTTGHRSVNDESYPVVISPTSALEDIQQRLSDVTNDERNSLRSSKSTTSKTQQNLHVSDAVHERSRVDPVYTEKSFVENVGGRSTSVVDIQHAVEDNALNVTIRGRSKSLEDAQNSENSALHSSRVRARRRTGDGFLQTSRDVCTAGDFHDQRFTNQASSLEPTGNGYSVYGRSIPGTISRIPGMFYKTDNDDWESKYSASLQSDQYGEPNIDLHPTSYPEIDKSDIPTSQFAIEGATYHPDVHKSSIPAESQFSGDAYFCPELCANSIHAQMQLAFAGATDSCDIYKSNSPIERQIAYETPNRYIGLYQNDIHPDSRIVFGYPTSSPEIYNYEGNCSPELQFNFANPVEPNESSSSLTMTSSILPPRSPVAAPFSPIYQATRSASKSTRSNISTGSSITSCDKTESSYKESDFSAKDTSETTESTSKAHESTENVDESSSSSSSSSSSTTSEATLSSTSLLTSSVIANPDHSHHDTPAPPRQLGGIGLSGKEIKEVASRKDVDIVSKTKVDKATDTMPLGALKTSKSVKWEAPVKTSFREFSSRALEWKNKTESKRGEKREGDVGNDTEEKEKVKGEDEVEKASGAARTGAVRYFSGTFLMSRFALWEKRGQGDNVDQSDVETGRRKQTGKIEPSVDGITRDNVV